MEASMIDVTVPLRSIGKEPGFITRSLILAYHGWGYNFYSVTDRLRSDDLLVRGKIVVMLNRASADLDGVAQKIAAEIPAATRKDPFPGEAERKLVKALRGFSAEVAAFSSSVSALAVPKSDQVWDRHRSQRDTLVKLQGFDLYLGQLAMNLQEFVAALTPGEAGQADVRGKVEVALAEMKTVVRERENALLI